MMEKLYRGLKYAALSIAGIFLGDSLHTWLDYRARPELYEVNSAPWYLRIQMNFFTAGGVILGILILRRILGKKLEK